ncbi:MAG TPA: efflux RND transporter periplasmic adaptor subunit [Draconibacterium sp.]|nr:efflux RND transporter periplasmic adaptor subunit [Draconibacterium sp.]
MPVQQINVVNVIQKDVPVYKEFVGEIFGEKDIPIRARVEGLVEGVHFDEGFRVKKGQLLYTIDPKPQEARVNAQESKVAEAETMLAKAKSDLDRYKPLAEINAVSKSDLDAKQAQYDAALSSLEAAKSNRESTKIELGYTRIYSPINGIIGKTKAKVGDFVGRDPNPVILNVVSETGNVKINFFLTESEYLTIFRQISNLREKQNFKADDKIRIKENNIELILSDGSVYNHKGTIDFIDRSVDATTGSIMIQANFPNPESILRPGLFGKVKVEMEVKEDAMLIPQRCVMELQGKYSVYVVNDSNKVETRQIETGRKIGDYWLVTNGLKPNEKLVIDALQKVRPQMEVSPTVVEFKSQSSTI